jgi:ubiquinone/menaquinone biosynthesis C-methylase UbiE
MFFKNGPTFFELARQALSSTRRGYDLLAPKFDASPFRTPDEWILPAVRALGEVDACLDICCGTGAGLRLLRPICRERLVGLDFSPGMLQQAKKNMEQVQGQARVEFVEGDVMAMSFEQEFDAATCFGGLGHIVPGEERLFLRRVWRALRPGGRFVFHSAYPPHPLSFWGIALRSFNAAMRIRNALLKPPFIMYYLTFLLPRIVEQLEMEGFSVVVQPALHWRHHLVVATRVGEPHG